jgi:alpha-D-xyloside xylohydrolase
MRDDSYLVGGFHGGDWQTMGELVVRWFQFSIFTSITRLHGDRHPSGAQYTGAPLSAECDPTGAAGGPVEPWAYGPPEAHALEGVKAALRLKQALKPYLLIQLQALATHGLPVMRPLWFDFAADGEATMAVSDQFLFGGDYMVAPVLEAGATARQVLFPGEASVTFTHFFSGHVYHGGSNQSVPVAAANTSEFPLFRIARPTAVQ